MPAFKVIYFDARGRAEPTRMMLAHAGQEFEDVRYTSEEWGKNKATTPMQQLPLLMVDSRPIPQGRAMHGFVAREFGLNGANNEETTKIDIIIATLEDIFDPLGRILFYEKDEEKKKKDLEAFYNEKSLKFLDALEKFLVFNKGGDGFFIGDKITRADIVFYCGAEAYGRDDVLQKYPKLFALKGRVAQDKNIAAYLAKRPVTSF
ncbi:S-crystallin 4-like [Asterias amurensis]|uniref:S-crystallin 4-like n=1 Tax=Asterias amurensis TaxID=7602 RepID=UPI003AB3E294